MAPSHVWLCLPGGCFLSDGGLQIAVVLEMGKHHAVETATYTYMWLFVLLYVLDKPGSRMHNETLRSQSGTELCMQAYQIANDNITDLLATGPSSQKPAVLETAERGTHVAVCWHFSAGY